MRRERVVSVCAHDPLFQGFSVPGPPALYTFVLEALVCWIDELKGCGDFEEYLMGGMNTADSLPA